MDSTKDKGDKGEDIAATFLIKNGFEVLNRYGSFKKEQINMDSLHLIIEAKKIATNQFVERQ